ncbi:hypothetical protein GIB67_013354 [Kingdonia uniflora]|uniref:Bifunctional inhibitor/plant lipid transfer protein/seed storage helical domain-containing protein n=1 Tax=Kingdonia uniflora TaxID=39325 RepID=A0A7J7LQS7_9MAGN|nr:hypothetical protein GIB67_013354 [Kingdonia uniflora]
MAKINSNALVLGVVLVVALMMMGGAQAKTYMLCNSNLYDFKPCLPSVRGPNPSPPTRACCNFVRSVDMPCLCKYKKNLPALGDAELIMGLPQKCGLPAPPENEIFPSGSFNTE